MKAWPVGVVMALSACASTGHPGDAFDPALARSFAALVDSVSFSDSRYGWSECCWRTLLVLRPRGNWTFVRLDSTIHWFEAPADSTTFRSIVARLVQLGFVAGWPPSFGSTLSDVPVAVLTLRAPRQCHQTSASPATDGEALPREWGAARAVLDSLAAHVEWQVRSPPRGALVDHSSITPGFLCGA